MHKLANLYGDEKVRKKFVYIHTQICQQFDKVCNSVKFFTITN